MNVALIPARGGSKRIPRKNIKEFCGKPMISYSIETAIKTGIFDEILISTNKGRVIRCAVKEIRVAGRNTQGVRIIKLSGEEKVVSAIKIEDSFN